MLGGNRLVVRNAVGGQMPFQLGRATACFNGEIYEFAGGTELDGLSILPAYQQHGLRFMEVLDGEYAACIWDDALGQLVLARDRFGTRPLAFGYDRDRVVFGSSARWVAETLGRGVVRSQQGPAYSHLYWPQEPHTSFDCVWTVPPGHLVLVNRDEISLRRGIEWPNRPSGSTSVEEILWNCLASRILSYDGPIAVPMSSGVDSGILAFATKALEVPVHVFSVVEVLAKRTVEADFIEERIARLQPASATLLSIGEEDVAQAIEGLFMPAAFDSMTLDNGALLTWCVARAVGAAGHKVMLDGTGGDELFDGYAFRDDIEVPLGWCPPPRRHLASLQTTQLAYAAKGERAGAAHSIEARFPFCASRLLSASVGRAASPGKEELRKFLLEELRYGPPLSPDLQGKFGFSMRGHDVGRIRARILGSWNRQHAGKDESANPRTCPFGVGYKKVSIKRPE